MYAIENSAVIDGRWGSAEAKNQRMCDNIFALILLLLK